MASELADSVKSVQARLYLANRKKQQSSSTYRCQKCLLYGHFTYECKNSRKYLQRPSRSKIMAKKKQDPVIRKLEVHKTRTKKRKQSSSSSSEITTSTSHISSSSSDEDRKRKRKKISSGGKRYASSSDSESITFSSETSSSSSGKSSSSSN